MNFNKSIWCAPLILKIGRKLKKDLETDGMSPCSRCIRWKTHCYQCPRGQAVNISTTRATSLVDGDYKFLWVNAGANGSLSDALKPQQTEKKN